MSSDEIQSMRDDWPAAAARCVAALEQAHASAKQWAAAVEGSPVHAAAVDATRELAGVLAGLPDRVHDITAITRGADAEYWKLADRTTGRPKPEAWAG